MSEALTDRSLIGSEVGQDVKPPIVVIEGDDVGVYPSQGAMSRHVEPIDVRDGIFEFYDSEGCLLRAVIDDDQRVQLVRCASACDPDELRRKISAYVRAVGLERIGIQPVELEREDLSVLLYRYLDWAARHGYT